MRNYVLEIGVEELPARFIPMALDQMAAKARHMVKEYGVEVAKIETYATPRRLVLWMEAVNRHMEETKKEVKGPAKAIAFDEDGEPTKALLGFLRGQGAKTEDVYIKELKGTPYVYVEVVEKALSFEEIIAIWAPEMIRSINFPKSMKWGGKQLRFARPIRWMVSLYGDEVVFFELEGIPVGRESRGHRFIGKHRIDIASADEYFSDLEKEGVIVDQHRRRDLISYQAKRLAVEVDGVLEDDPALIEEVVQLVEYPTALRGSIADRYLSLPDKVITTPMREHLRYIPVYDEEGALMPYFITVRNGGRQGLDTVTKGNEKVLTARLADAEFFFEEDLKRPLADYVEDLKGVTFHDRLGNLYQKTERLRRLVAFIATELSVGENTVADLDRAAYLSKADLLTNMVIEFTELQGFMGREYAKRSGEKDLVSLAIEEQYMPRFAEDNLPETTAGAILSLADKLDTLVGLFCIGISPTGSQDPFAQRRSALGIVNILLQKNLDLNLSKTVDMVLEQYEVINGLEFQGEEVKEAVMNFFLGRMKNLMQTQDIRYDIIDAVLPVPSPHLLDLYKKTHEIQNWMEAYDPRAMVEAYSRVANLIKDVEEVPVEEEFLAVAERPLYDHLKAEEENWASLQRQGDYMALLNALQDMVPLIDQYFEANMIMVDDETLRRNRLALLNMLYRPMAGLMDISQIVVK